MGIFMRREKVLVVAHPSRICQRQKRKQPELEESRNQRAFIKGPMEGADIYKPVRQMPYTPEAELSGTYIMGL